MKRTLLLCICLATLMARAQDTVKKSNSVGKFDEQYTVLKSDKKIRQGSYRLFTNKKLVAAGTYEKNKRSGLWSFYDNDKLVQQYDYAANKLALNETDPTVKCEVESANPGDAVQPAVKVGGQQGFRFFVASANFDDNISEGGRNLITHVLNIDENGQVKSWVASVKSADGIKILNPSTAVVSSDVVQFIPATLNGKPVACNLTFSDEMKGGPGFKQGGDDQGKASMRGGGRHGGKP